jgi:hypothetical protein
MIKDFDQWSSSVDQALKSFPSLQQDLEVRQSAPQQHIFARPSVCSPSISERNFCNCKGGNSKKKILIIFKNHFRPKLGAGPEKWEPNSPATPIPGGGPMLFGAGARKW